MMKKRENERKTEEIKGKYSLKWNKSAFCIHNFAKFRDFMYILFAKA